MEKRYIILSMSRALLQRVTPNLRAVCIESTDEILNVAFYYEESPSEGEQELAGLAFNEFIADFSHEINVGLISRVLPASTTIPLIGICAYRRYEEGLNSI